MITAQARKRLVVEQVDLDPGLVMVFRESDDTVRLAYDPCQAEGAPYNPAQAASVSARMFVGMHCEFTQGPELDALWDTYLAEPVGSPLGDAIGIMFDEIDRTQDPAGVAEQMVELLEQVRAKKRTAVSASRS